MSKQLDPTASNRLMGSIIDVMRGKINESLEEKKMSTRDKTKAEAMDRWLDQLQKVIESSTNSSAKQKFVIEYSNWVRTNGHFYQSVLNTNPALAEIFEVVEESLNIKVKIQPGKKKRKIREEYEELNEAESDEFIETFVQMLDKLPESNLKSRFVYQFDRWQKENQSEMFQVEKHSPTINTFLQRVVQSLDPDALRNSDVVAGDKAGDSSDQEELDPNQLPKT